MKRHFEHPAPSERELHGPRYWRSLEELAQTPGFQEHVAREFPEGASQLDGVDRRHFFKIMAASFALGGVGLAGCRRPEAHILPYSRSVERVVPGLPLYFATAMPSRGGAVPLIAETHQGRPTKLEGNPSYQPYGGATNLMAQAAVLDLYDPDRATASTRGRAVLGAAQVNDLLASIGRAADGSDGAGLAFLAEESTSLTRRELVRTLRRKWPKAIWAEYEPVDVHAPQRAATAVYGRPALPVYRFAAARRILALDADFLAGEPGAIAYARDHAKSRRVIADGQEPSRLYAAESRFTITGSNADHRIRVASSAIPAFAAAIGLRVLTQKGRFPELQAELERIAAGLEVDSQWLDSCAQDLLQNPRRSVVVAGSDHAPEVHAIVLAINEALEAPGHTMDLVAVEPPEASTLRDLAAAIRGGNVRTLVVLGGNPVYNAPADLDWATLQRSVPEVIRYGYYVDETSSEAQVHLHATHFLESWGDARAADGTILAIQPMILPLFSALSEIEVLARILGDEITDGYGLVFRTITGLAGVGGEKGFQQFLHDGLLSGTAFRKLSATARPAALAELTRRAQPAPALSRSHLEVRFVADSKVDDGRYANNGWLQECPEPITKIAWDNAIQVSPRLAKELGIEAPSSLIQVARKNANVFTRGKQAAPVAEIRLGDRIIKGPVHIQPGLANYTLVLPLGYGRRVTGRIGRGAGFDAYPLRTLGAPTYATGATLEITREVYLLANTQEHWAMEGRDIVREANYGEHIQDPHWANSFGMEHHSPPIYGADQDAPLAEKVTRTPRGNSLYEHPEFTGIHQWGMSIDLNTCIGCNACVIACQAENNIPIVGKDQVLRGREMHWIRLDRYYATGSTDNTEIPEDPQVAIQPMACQHCETAPCETVCPVNATVHDEEGLNVMAYNRCVGTRYCANNCPYKVRRFNFFDWQQRARDQLYLGPLAPKGMPELLKMVQNPDVTVRMRGVMEKCTYCVQRIQQAKIAQKVKAGPSDDVKVRDGTFQVACQQACPTEAIAFGDLLDPASAVSQAKSDTRTYNVLGYLNVRPRTTYLGRVRNPNPAMPDYRDLPLTRLEYRNANTPSGGRTPVQALLSNGRTS
jgi:MoCo/4Fe-4S cofactor protein with predicted Tat translocation signal